MTPKRMAFIVRIWIEHERSPNDGRRRRVLRGSLQPANEDDGRYFTSLDEMAVLLAEIIEDGNAVATGMDDDL